MVKVVGFAVLVVAVLTLAIMSWGSAVDDCKARGGHMERIWGGKSTRYFCDGATK